MNGLRAAAKKLVGLFVDDPVLAAGIAAWIVLIASLGYAGPSLAVARALALALGLGTLLTLSILHAAGTSR